MRKLENKVAIVTGAANGMGKATVKKMVEYGAKVVAIDFLPEVMDYAEELRNAGYEVNGCVVDVRDANRLKVIYKDVYERYGRIDAVVNAAGVAVFNDFIDDAIDAEAHREIDINYFGVWNSCRAAIPYMKEAFHLLRVLWYVIQDHLHMLLQRGLLWRLQKL